MLRLQGDLTYITNAALGKVRVTIQAQQRSMSLEPIELSERMLSDPNAPKKKQPARECTATRGSPSRAP
jgi:hypothetical protein